MNAISHSGLVPRTWQNVVLGTMLVEMKPGGPNRPVLQKVAGACPHLAGGCHLGAGTNTFHIRLFPKSTLGPGVQVPSPGSLLQHCLELLLVQHDTTKTAEQSHASTSGYKETAKLSFFFIPGPRWYGTKLKV